MPEDNPYKPWLPPHVPTPQPELKTWTDVAKFLWAVYKEAKKYRKVDNPITLGEIIDKKLEEAKNAMRKEEGRKG